jgi:hypothetical protein
VVAKTASVRDGAEGETSALAVARVKRSRLANVVDGRTVSDQVEVCQVPYLSRPCRCVVSCRCHPYPYPYLYMDACPFPFPFPSHPYPSFPSVEVPLAEERCVVATLPSSSGVLLEKAAHDLPSFPLQDDGHQTSRLAFV